MGTKLQVDVGLNSTQASRGIDALKNKINSIGSGLSSIGSSVAGFAAIAGIGLGVSEAVGYVKEMITQADDLAKASQRVGVSAEEWQKYAYMAQISGASVDDVETAFRKMKKTISEAGNGLESAQETLGRLGLNFKDLQAMPVAEQFDTVVAAIQNVGNASDKTALTMEVFGKSGDKLTPMIDNFQTLKNEASELGVVFSNETCKAAEAFGDSMSRVSNSIKASIANTGLVEWLADVADRLDHVTSKAKGVEAELAKAKGTQGGSSLYGGSARSAGFALDYLTFGYGTGWAEQLSGDATVSLGGYDMAGVKKSKQEREEKIKAAEASKKAAEALKLETAERKKLEEQKKQEAKTQEKFGEWLTGIQKDNDYASAKLNGSASDAEYWKAWQELQERLGRSMTKDEQEKFDILQKESLELEKQAKLKETHDKEQDYMAKRKLELDTELRIQALKNQGRNADAESLSEQLKYYQQFKEYMSVSDRADMDKFIKQKQDMDAQTSAKDWNKNLQGEQRNYDQLTRIGLNVGTGGINHLDKDRNSLLKSIDAGIKKLSRGMGIEIKPDVVWG